MEYTVKKLASLAGVSTRTLRYYDEIGILKPARINSSGYRIYGQVEVDTLQQILFYRELEVSLDYIKEIITSPYFDSVAALREHREKLIAKREQLDLLIANVNKTIALTEGRVKMSNKEKFEGFKRKMISDNEKEYGKEAREKYDDKQVNKSNEIIKNMTEKQYTEWMELSENVIKTLKEAFATGDPASDIAQRAVDLHRQWLSYTWDSYTKEAHAGLAQMYVDDERFEAYYDKEQPGLTEFLRDAVLFYAGIK